MVINRIAQHSAWAHPFMTAFAVWGVAIFGVLALAAWWNARNSPDAPRAVAAAVWTAAATVVAVGLNQPIATAVHRPRPFLAMPGAEVLVARTHDFSFPSDHAVAAAAATAGIWLVARHGGVALRRLALVSTVLAGVLAFARVYVGAHYPGDVLAGLLIGSAITLLGWVALRRPLITLTRRVATNRRLRGLVVGHNGSNVEQQPA